MARQLFVSDTAQMDPMDLKTFTQFYLLGDPSLHPIAKRDTTGIPTDEEKASAEQYYGTERRQKMMLAGNFLNRDKTYFI